MGTQTYGVTFTADKLVGYFQNSSALSFFHVIETSNDASFRRWVRRIGLGCLVRFRFADFLVRLLLTLGHAIFLYASDDRSRRCDSFPRIAPAFAFAPFALSSLRAFIFGIGRNAAVTAPSVAGCAGIGRIVGHSLPLTLPAQNDLKCKISQQKDSDI